MRYKATVKNGKMIVQTRDKFVSELTVYEGKEIAVSIEKWQNKRSTQENRYYWKCVVGTIANETGHDPDEIHDFLKAMFLMEQGNKMPIVRATKSLSTVEFEKYLEQCRAWSLTELQVKILLPNEVSDEQLDNYYS